MLIGLIYFRQNKSDQALQLLQQAQSIVRESGNRSQEVLILRNISILYALQKKIDSALEFGQQALVLAQSNKLRHQQMYSLKWLGQAYINRVIENKLLGNYQLVKSDSTRSLEFSQQALTLARELKIQKAEADSLAQIGIAYGELKEYQLAIEALQQSASIARVIKDLDIESSVLTSLTSIYTERGDRRKELEVQLRLLEIYREQKDKFFEAVALINLGSTYIVINEYQKAVEAYQQAIAAVRQVEIGKLPANLQNYALALEFQSLDGLSRSYSGFGQIDKALDFAQQALLYAQTIRKPNLEAQALLKLSFLYTNTFKDFQSAIAHSQQALTIAKQIKAPQLEAKALENLSYAYNKQGNQPKALESANQLLEIAKRLKNTMLEAGALNKLSDIYENQGNYQKVLELAQQQLALVQKEKLGGFETIALFYLSKGYLLTGDTTKAVETAKLAITLAKQQHSPGDEAIALLQLSVAYKVRGEYDLGIQAAQSAFGFSQASKNFLVEVAATSVISEIYEALGEYQKVIAVAEPALKLSQKINNRISSAELLSYLGNAYRTIGDYTKAKEFLEPSLKIARELKNPRLELNALDRLSRFYFSLQDYQKALELSQQSLKIAQSLKSPPLLVSLQFTLGDIYSKLGDYPKSREFYQQALTTAQQLKNRENEGIALLNQASTYFALGEPQKTVELSKLALTIFQEIKVPRLEAFAHRMLSVGYGELGNDAQAIAEAQTFLTFAQKTQNSLWEKSALNLIGSLHQKFGRIEQAIATYQQALAIKTDNQERSANWGIYAGLGQVYRDLNQPTQAINYYKQAIIRLDKIRLNIQGLPPQLQQSFLQATVDFNKVKTADIYRQYADLLLKQGRTVEAQPILELLKYQEAQDYLSNTRGSASTVNDQVVALGKELTELESVPKEKRHPQQQRRIIELRKLRIQKTNTEFGQFLQTSEVAKRIQELRQITGSENLDVETQIRNLQGSLKQLQQDAVLIYPLVLKDRLELVIVTSYSPPIHRTVAVSEEELNRVIDAFRKDLQNPGSDARVHATKLYEWLIKPIENDLQDAKAKTILYAPDGKLRYIPLAALYDGKQWLIERFRINNITALSLTNLNSKRQDKLQILGAAFTNINRIVKVKLGKDEATFRGLTFAGIEVENIAATIPGTTKILDDEFTPDIVYQMNDYTVVHLATHAAFVSGKPEDSVILFGDGKYATLRDVQNWDLSNVDLVILSACETGLGGLGDGREILGFGYQMQRTQAKAVIATLWSVDDGGTQTLMSAFYTALQKPNTTKAEALKAAQISLITSDFEALNKQRGGLTPQPINDSLPSKVKSYLSHPYYWAPFILIGNGL